MFNWTLYQDPIQVLSLMGPKKSFSQLEKCYTKGKDIEDLTAVTGGVVPDFSVLLSRQRLSIPDTERGKCIIGITYASSSCVVDGHTDDIFQIRCDLPTVNVADNLDKPLRLLGIVSEFNYGTDDDYFFFFHNNQTLADSGILCSNPFDRPIRFRLCNSEGDVISKVKELNMVLDIQFIDP